MMKRPEFLETKRTPRYSLRKLNVGVASVLLGVTIFGINFTDHSVKAATNNLQPTVLDTTGTGTGTDTGTGTTGTGTGTDTDTGTTGTDTGTGTNTGTNTGSNTGSDRSAAVTVNPDNINTQPDKENQELANKHNLTSSDNHSSNIYKGTDGKYYKIVTIYGNDYVYHTADIQANSTDTTAEDTKNNINISKEDLGNGKTRWTVVFFPKKGLQNVGSRLSGLSSAKFGIALTNDYQILGNVDMDVISDPKQTFSTYIFKPGSNRATETTVQNPPAEVKFSFNPKTDVDENTGLINSKTMPAYNNKYLQGPYYFTTATDIGKKNLWQTYFKKWSLFGKVYNNAYDKSPYVGNDHQLYFNSSQIKNKTGVDGAKEGDLVIYDTRDGVNGVFNSVNFNQAMEFKSQGVTDQAQFSSYKISFTTQHTDSYEVGLTTPGSKNQQFSGISANIYSYQNGGWNGFSRLYGEQRALNPAGVVKQAKDVVSGWGPANTALGQIKQDYLNNAQINVLRNKILNNITDHDAVNNIIKEGNSLNDAMKKLGNSIGQYDSDGSFANHKEDTTKASDRYKYASPDKKAAYDNATEVTKALINKDTGTYADQATVETLTDNENKAWSALDGKKPTDTESYHVTAKDGVSVDKGAKVDPGSLVNVTDPAGKPVELKPGSVDWKEGAKPDLSTSGDKTGKVEVTLPDGSKTEVPVHLHVKSDAESDKVTAKDGVSVDKGAKVDPGSLVNVTDPAGKPVELKPGSVDWKEGAKPDLSTSGDKTGKVEVTFLDGSKKDTDVTIHVKTDAETYDPKAQPWTTTVGKTPKADEVISSTDKNGKKMPSDAKYTWKTEPNTSKTGEAFGEVKVTYSDGSHDDVPVTINVKDKDKLNDKEKYHIYGKDGLKVDNGKTLDPKDTIVVKDIDGNQTTLPEGSTVKWTKGKEPDFSQAGKDVTGEVTVTYPDHTQSDSVTVTVHVNGESDEYKVAPRDGVTVQRGGQVDPESTVVAQTPDGKPTSFPDGTKHEWITKPDTDSTGKRTGVVKTTFQDGSTTTTTVSVNVEPNQSDKIKPNVPATKEPVANTSSLTKDEKDKVKTNVTDANKDKFPAGTTVEVGKDGTATVTYPDTSTDTIKGSDLVRPETEADKIKPNVPATKEPVANTSSLTKDEKDKVKTNVTDANKDKFPAGTTVEVGKDGTATVTYPDTSTDTIKGSDLVRPETEADKIKPNVPATKEPVANTSSLTKDEKDKVKTNVTDANKDKFPAGTTVEVGDDGTATVTYPDGSKDTIPGDQLVQGQKGSTTDAGNITPTVPGDKVTVKDPSHLTDDEKNQVKNNVDNANKDKFPAGTEVTVGDDGTATVTYPDGSKDTIPGDQLVQGQKGSTTDAGNITPTVPGDKVTVKDPSHLTDDEKKQVKNNVDNANKDKFPAGTTVTVGDDGTATVTYPDGSKDTIPGDQLVQGQKGSTTDAGNITPTVPGDKVTVKDPSHLTDDEKKQVKNNVDNANKDKFPAGTTVTVGDDGTATVTYPDGSKDTIPGDQLVQGQKGDTTDAGKITPTVSGDKVTVKDPSHLTDDEKNQVKNNVDNANKDKFPAGTEVTVGDDGTATVTYPDGSKDTIPGDQLVQGQKGDTTDAG
ncbi:LEA family epithelial adhesin, partial [Limosilactobacillus reuteri]